MCLLLKFSEVLKIAMTVKEIIMLVVAIVVIAITLVSTIPMIIKSRKKIKAAQEKIETASTEAEAAAAEAELETAKNDLYNQLFNIVPTVETMFNKITNVLSPEVKEQKPYSGMKKAVAESKLKTYADAKGYTDVYDPEFWAQEIEKVVAVMNTSRDAVKKANTATVDITEATNTPEITTGTTK